MKCKYILLSTITVQTCNLKLSVNKEVKECLYFTYAIFFLKIDNGINKNQQFAFNTD